VLVVVQQGHCKWLCVGLLFLFQLVRIWLRLLRLYVFVSC
jgi:hypothetical protein